MQRPSALSRHSSKASQPIERAVRATVEMLEQRVMLAVTPVIGTISDSVMLGTAIHVDAVGSNFDGQSPQNLDIQWDFGDTDAAGRDQNHNRMRGFNAAHLYTAAGTYTIGLSVTDPLGNTTWTTRQITIAPDTRTLLTINSQGQLDSIHGIAANTRVEFVGSAYTFNHSISLGGNVVLTSANADGGRTRLNAVDGLYEFFTVNGSNVTIGDLSLDTPSRAGVSGSAGTAMGFEASGQRQNITLENCELLNLNHVFVGNSKPTGVLFQDNVAPVVGGLRGHIAWAEGSRWTYVGNTTASNSQSIINTATNISLVNISDNSFSRSTSGGVNLDYGPEYIYIGGNKFNRAKTQTNGTWTGVIVDKAQYIRFERNDVNQADIVVRAGTAHTIFTHNTFTYEGNFYAAFQFNLGYDAGKGLTVEDVVVSHNTLRPNGYNMAGFMIHNPPTGLTIEGNLFDATGMSVGVEQRSGMYTKVPLSALTIGNNGWVLPSAGYGGAYQYNNWSWRTPAQWSASVPSDVFYNTYADAVAGGAGSAVKPVVTGASSTGEGSSYALSLNPGGWEASRLHWLIDWGDGVVQAISGMAGTAVHAYGDGPASYNISATANDGIGNYTPGSLAVAVENSAPVAGFQADPPGQMTAGDTVAIVSTVTDAAADLAAGFSYQWSVTKDGQTYSPNTPVDQAAFSFTPNLAGMYVITLTATDKDGGVGTISRQVEVVPPTTPTTPAAPTGLALAGSASGILLDWSDNTENDLAGYNVYRSGSPNGTYTKLNISGLIMASAYNDTSASENANSYYRVTAMDSNGNESITSGDDGVGSAYRPPTHTIPVTGGLIYVWNLLDNPAQTYLGVSGGGWSPSLTLNMPINNNSHTLTLSNLPIHSGVRVWIDGTAFNGDPLPDEDQVNLIVAGQTFSRSTPRPPSTMSCPLGSTDISHTADSLTITVGGSGFEAYPGDFWVLSEVNVMLLAPPTVSIGKVQDGSEDPDPAGPNPPDEGPKPVIFSISRIGGLDGNANALTVHLDDPSGSAKEVEDYKSLPDSVTIPAGAGFVEFEVMPKDDDKVEPDEKVILRLKPDPNNVYALAQADPKAEAVIADNDYVVSFEIDRLTAAHVSDTEEHWGVPVNGYASSVFRVQLYALNYFGQVVEVRSGTEQLYTLDLDGAGGTISQVADSAGHTWSLNGPTASFWTDEPLTGTSFDVAVTFSFTSPGVKMVTLQGSVNAQSGPVVLSRSSKGSSNGRAIAPAPAPGPVVIPPAIYHILDENGAGGNGHSAVIIPTPNGCMYYSYSADGSVVTMNYNNIDDAMAQARAAGYTHYQKWNGVNAQEATTARNAAMAFNGTEYRVTQHNCWHMVYAALNAAGTDAGDFGDVPNVNYSKNAQGLADESGPLP